MKKNFATVNNILMGVFAFTAVMTSCSDDYDYVQNTTEQQVKSNISTNDPLGIGIITLNTNIEKLNEDVIPVNTNRVTITGNNPNIEYKLVSENDKNFIRIFYHGNDIVESDIVTIKHMDKDISKSVFVTINSKRTTRGIVGNSMEDKLIGVLSCGFIPNTIAPNAIIENSIFDKETMLQIDKSNKLLTLKKSFYSNYFFDKATNKTEKVKNDAKTIGFELTAPIKGWNFSLGGSYTNNTNEINKTERETATYGWKVRTATGNLDLGYLCHILDEKFNKGSLDNYIENLANNIMAVDKNYNIEELKKDIRIALAYQNIMTQSFNDEINNPSNSPYKIYSNDINSLKKLIANRGMYVSTTCQMGGMSQTTMTRNSTFSEISMEWLIKMNATASQSKTISETETIEKTDSLGRVVSRVIKNNPNAAKISINIEKKSTVKDIFEAMDVHTNTESWGGDTNVKDIDKWTIKTDNPEEWVCISYATPTNESFGLPNNNNFIPIWKLCLDPARRKVLRELTEPDENGKIPFFNYEPEKAKHLVIADVQLKKYPRGTNEKDIIPYYAKDNRANNSKKHLYIPMRNNNLALGESRSPLSLGRGEFLLDSKRYDNKYITNIMVPFVAYEWVYEDDKDDFTGITSIAFGENTQNNQRKCSERTFEMVTGSAWYCTDGNQYLLLEYAQANTPINERIKAVGFMYSNESNNFGDVFASSIGTELNSNYDTSAEYKKHWGDKNFINSDCKNMHIFKGKTRFEMDKIVPFVKIPGRINNDSYEVKQKIYPCASTKEISNSINIENLMNDAVK